jgi:mannose-6-phosphate isomerase
VNPAPARLAPHFVSRIWGARTLQPLFEAPPGPQPIGEVWLTGEESVFASGDFTGRKLSDVWPSLPPEWTGTRIQRAARIPLLVKFLFPEDKLSIQVHPADDYARAHEPGTAPVGKTEMWYVIDSRSDAQIAVGFRHGVTRESFQSSIENGTVEDALQQITVRPGKTYFVPAGTPHMIGPGMVICEIQQHSDITYRVFDFNRRQADGILRPLHIRQAMDVLNFGPSRGGTAHPVQVQSRALAKTYLTACAYFATEKWEFSRSVESSTSSDRFELLIPIFGSGRIATERGSLAYGPAQVWLLPASLGAYRLIPESATTLLRTYVPDLQALAKQLAAEGVSPADAFRVIHL